MKLSQAAAALVFALVPFTALAQNYPAPKQSDWIAKDFKFHTGEVIPDLRIGYTTVGEPSGQSVLVLHGTGGSANSMLTPAFAGQLFGPGQPLDASRYYIIIPDAVGHGRSAKPSDGLRTKFPKYNYEDMVDAQYRLVKEGLGIRHLRLVIGNSMGGMHTWIWAVKYPDRNHFVQRQIRLLGNQTQQKPRMFLQRRCAAATRLCCNASCLLKALGPKHHHTGAHPIAFGRLPPRRACRDVSDHADTQVHGIRPRHRLPPKSESRRTDSLIDKRLGIPPIQPERHLL
jgi:homoserine O-acetyltransferase/O-succinyltransferase